MTEWKDTPVCQDDDVICYCSWVTKRQILEKMPYIRTVAELKAKTGSAMTCLGCMLDFDHVVYTHRELLGSAVSDGPVTSCVEDARVHRIPRPSVQRQVSWVVEAKGMSTRLVISNIRVPSIEHDLWPMPFTLTLYDPEGQPIYCDGSCQVEKNRTMCIEFKPIVRKVLGEVAFHGLVQIDGVQPYIGGTRFWVHWYNRNGITSSHERFDNAIYSPRLYDRFFGNTGVDLTGAKDTHFVLSNLHVKPYSTAIVLQNFKKEKRRSWLTVPPNGSVFESIEAAFEGARGFLDNRPGLLYYENRAVCAAHYHAVYNKARDLWQIQHT